MLGGAVSLCMLLWSFPLHADEQKCEWIWNCTNGPCRHIPQCEHNYDIVPPEPMELPPVSPLDMGSQPAALYPPAGNETCVPQHICDTAGNCEWQTKC